MPYTETDLVNVEAAITALMTGKRAVQGSFADKMVRYGEVTLQDLQKLKLIIQQDLGLFASRTYAKQGGRGR
ncbi:MAG: gpW family head-tail joining protein [Pseudomonadota bacterium]